MSSWAYDVCLGKELLTMDQTIQLAFRIALVWAMGFLIAAAVRALLPGTGGVSWPTATGSIFLAYRKVAYWTCILATLTVTVLVVVRAILADFGPGTVN
jgi:hypothetical protein